jgi:hypothetical protein
MLNQVLMDSGASNVQVFCCAGPAVSDSVRTAATAINQRSAASTIQVSGDYFSEGRAGQSKAVQSLLEMSYQMHSADLIREIIEVAGRAVLQSEKWRDVIKAASRTLRRGHHLDHAKTMSMHAIVAEVKQLLSFCEGMLLAAANEDRRVMLDRLEILRLSLLGSLAPDKQSTKAISLQTVMPVVTEAESVSATEVSLAGPPADDVPMGDRKSAEHVESALRTHCLSNLRLAESDSRKKSWPSLDSKLGKEFNALLDVHDSLNATAITKQLQDAETRVKEAETRARRAEDAAASVARKWKRKGRVTIADAAVSLTGSMPNMQVVSPTCTPPSQTQDDAGATGGRRTPRRR